MKIRYKQLYESVQKISPEFVLNYIQKLSTKKEGGRGISYGTPKWILAHNYFIKKKLKVNGKILGRTHMKPYQIERDSKRIKRFINMKSPFPPIVVGFDKMVSDGFHRLEAARLRENEYIDAYIGIVDKDIPNPIRKELWGF